jgi:hypothetical protein
VGGAVGGIESERGAKVLAGGGELTLLDEEIAEVGAAGEVGGVGGDGAKEEVAGLRGVGGGLGGHEQVAEVVE